MLVNVVVTQILVTKCEIETNDYEDLDNYDHSNPEHRKKLIEAIELDQSLLEGLERNSDTASVEFELIDDLPEQPDYGAADEGASDGGVEEDEE